MKKIILLVILPVLFSSCDTIGKMAATNRKHINDYYLYFFVANDKQKTQAIYEIDIEKNHLIRKHKQGSLCANTTDSQVSLSKSDLLMIDNYMTNCELNREMESYLVRGINLREHHVRLTFAHRLQIGVEIPADESGDYKYKEIIEGLQKLLDAIVIKNLQDFPG